MRTSLSLLAPLALSIATACASGDPTDTGSAEEDFRRRHLDAGAHDSGPDAQLDASLGDAGGQIDAGARDSGPDAQPDAGLGDASLGDAGGDAGSGGSTCDGGPCIPAGLLDPSYTTTWNPGILADTPTGQPLGPDNLPVRTTTCASVPAQSTDATSAIQSALNGCAGKNQVVMLAAGTYRVSSTIQVPSGVVLRGAGSDATTGTAIVSTHGGPVVAIGTLQDGVCYDGRGFDATTEPLLTQNAMKETSTVTVASGSNFHAGDVALIDQNDSAQVSEGDCTYYKRVAGRGESERVQIANVSGNTLTLATPLHWTFTTAQSARVAKVISAPIEWAGIESVLVQGGRPGGYPGQYAGGIDIANAAHCWVKDVQIDGTNSGMPIRLGGTYRCVVRDSHIHNSYSYGFAQDNYGITLACGSADNLVENNIVRFLDKGINLMNSGGGNVIGYNYVDNSWSVDGSCGDAWQELQIDTHCAFPHMELIEGNWAPHMGASTTHGNAGYLTYFRNYSSSQFSPSNPSQPGSAIVWSQPFTPQYGQVTTLQFDSPDLNMTVIGNVLGSTSDTSLGLPADLGTTSTGGAGTSTSTVYVSTGSGPSIFTIDSSTVSWTSLWATGNFDTINKKVMWNATSLTANLPASTQNLPASLYHPSRPGWWPSGSAWPWVNPTGSPKVGSLPAKTRSGTFNYYETSDPSCTLHCSTYCCSVGTACSL